MLAIFDVKKTPYTTKIWILTFDVIIMSLFAGLRWKTGTDWDQYIDCFRKIRDHNMFGYYRYGEQYFEPLYSFMNWLTKVAVGKDGYSYFLLWTSFVQYGLMGWTCKKISRTPLLAFAGLVSIQLGFPTARTAVAFSLLIASFVFIKERKLTYYLSFVIIASLIHKMCLVFMPCYWLFNNIRINYIMALTIYSFSIAFSIVADKYLPDVGLLVSSYAGDSDLNEKIATYTSRQTNEGALKSLSSYLLSYFWITLFFYQKKKLVLTRKSNNLYNILLFSYIISISITSAFAIFFSDLTRISVVYNTWPFLLGYTFVFLKKYKELCFSLILLFFLYRLVQFFNDIYFEEYYSSYTWIFDK